MRWQEPRAGPGNRGFDLIRRGAAKMVARCRRAVRRQNLVNVLGNAVFTLAIQLCKAQRFQRLAERHGALHCPADELMSVTERHVFAHQIICQVGRRGVAEGRRVTHGGLVGPDIRYQTVERS